MTQTQAMVRHGSAEDHSSVLGRSERTDLALELGVDTGKALCHGKATLDVELLARSKIPDAQQAIAEEIGREVDYQPVAADGATRAAALIAELL